MAYDISGKPAPASAAAKSGQDASSSKAGSRKSGAAADESKKTIKVVAAVGMLGAGIYLLVAGNIGLFPFDSSVPKPAPVSETEKKLMQSAPTKASEIPNVKEFESMPENRRPIKAGS